MDKTRFMGGKSFDEYLLTMDSANREGFMAAYAAAALDEEQIASTKTVDSTVYLLAVSESWCGDCRINVPVMARLEEANPKIVLRCHGKGASSDLDTEKIPTFIVYDSEFGEIGRWVERPESVGKGLQTDDQAAKRDLRRRYNAGEFQTETFFEVLQILKKRG